jgi:hypothetical protein
MPSAPETYASEHKLKVNKMQKAGAAEKGDAPPDPGSICVLLHGIPQSLHRVSGQAFCFVVNLNLRQISMSITIRISICNEVNLNLRTPDSPLVYNPCSQIQCVTSSAKMTLPVFLLCALLLSAYVFCRLQSLHHINHRWLASM